MEKIHCTVCGGELEEKDKNLFKCKFCGAKFREENREDSLIEYFNREKQEQRARACKNLYCSVNDVEEYDTAGILNYARELKSLCPEHFLANFYEVACGDDEREIKRFLEGMDTQKDGVYLPQVIKFMLRIAELKHMAPLKSLLERAKNQGVLDSGEYHDYITEIETLERDIDSGRFDPSIPRDVFIAYSSKDIDEVDKVVEFLEEEGEISCWTAARNLRHGKGGLQNYWEGITTAISNCSGIVFISTKHSRTLECEAVHKEKNHWGMVGELPYIENNHPEMFRVQYFPPSDKGECTEGARRVLDRFFTGVEDCRDLKTLREWVLEKKLSSESEYIRAEKKKAEERRENVKFCKNCGTENALTSKFCSKCAGSEFCDSREEYVRISTEKRLREEFEKKIKDLQSEKDSQLRSAQAAYLQEKTAKSKAARTEVERKRAAKEARLNAKKEKAEAAKRKREEKNKKNPWRDPDYPTLKNYDQSIFQIRNKYLSRYMGKGGVVKIPKGVVRIKGDLFSYYNCDFSNKATTFYIPKSVKKINYYLFQGMHHATIYCEAKRKPLRWTRVWDTVGWERDQITPIKAKVYFGYRGEQNTH